MQTDPYTVTESLSLFIRTHLSHSPAASQGVKGTAQFDDRVSRTAALKRPVDLREEKKH